MKLAKNAVIFRNFDGVLYGQKLADPILIGIRLNIVRERTNQMEPVHLEKLAYKFFREFARYEYCLKVTGLREDKREAKASWSKYAAEVTHVIDAPQAQNLVDAVVYFTDYPPKKQIIKDGALAWDETLPDHKSKAELILLLVCRVRNNLFHGGKFNGRWFEPQRSENLMQHALVILRACATEHPKVSEAYAGSALE